MAESKKSRERVNQLLQEIRIVLPGTLALLGFQFIAFFNESFNKLSTGLQYYHLVNLLFITGATILLIAPVAFQELFENGRSTKRFLQFTSRVIAVALFFLLIGLSGNVFVACTFLGKSGYVVPALAAAAIFLFGLAMWFGVSLIQRRMVAK